LEIAEIDLLPSGALTLFGPTNDAFDALGQGRLAFLTAPANQMELVTLLAYHLVWGIFTSGQLSNGRRTYGRVRRRNIVWILFWTT
jgi:uncharacterized surface protein with fasciclin (FAS1) repeats